MKKDTLLNFLSSIREEISKYEAQGTLSPIVSSSGQQIEDPDSSDNSVEYYLKKEKKKVDYLAPKDSDYKPTDKVCSTCKFFVDGDSCKIVSGRIDPQGYCKLYFEGGEKMTEKGLDVENSETVDRSYDPGVESTTEPDPQSELAMQKGFNGNEKDSSKQDGVGTYSTTANSTVDAPSPGDTTEPTKAMNKGEDGDSMQLCNCAGMGKCVGCACSGCQTCDGCDGDDCQGCGCEHSMTKAACDCCGDCGPDCKGDCCDSCSVVTKAAGDCCDNCGPDCNGDCCDNCSRMKKSVDEQSEVQKSIWGGMFAPIDPAGSALRTVFRQDQFINN